MIEGTLLLLGVGSGIVTFLGFADALSHNLGSPQVLHTDDPLVLRVLWASFLLLWAGIAAGVGGYLFHLRRRFTDRALFGGTVASEPHGPEAIVWGVLTFAPTSILFVLFGVLIFQAPVVTTCLIALSYWAGATIGARIYYGRDKDHCMRASIERPKNRSHVITEIETSIAWSFLISACGVGFVLVYRMSSGLGPPDVWYVAAAICLPPIFAIGAVFIAVVTSFPSLMADALRGPFAAMALRTFCLLSMLLLLFPV